jgi:hypothetical protein
MEAEYRSEANDKKREGKLKEAERLRRRAKYNRNKAERLSSEVDGLEGNANHIDTEGYFRFVFGQDLKTGVLYANLGQIIIPPYVRRMGAATLFFAEYVRLCQEMKVPLIFANRATGMHAYWGMQFLEANEKSKVTLLFRDYLGKYVTGSPDLSTMSTIENPQQIADAYLDPETGSLVVPADVLQEDPNSLFIQLHHSDYQVGKEFMWDEDLEWKAVFDTDPKSISSRILGRSLQKVLNRLYPYTSRETN